MIDSINHLILIDPSINRSLPRRLITEMGIPGIPDVLTDVGGPGTRTLSSRRRHCFGRVPLWRGGSSQPAESWLETRCFVAGPTLQARSLAEKSYARGGWSEYKGGPCVILHRSEQCAVKHGRRSFPVSRAEHTKLSREIARTTASNI